MKILHTVHSANPIGGGVIEAINQLSAAHQRQGHTVQIASLDSPNAPWIHSSPVRVWALGRGRGGYSYEGRFHKWIRQHCADFDIVVVNGLWQYSSSGVWRAMRNVNTPYVVFPHGMLDPWFNTASPRKYIKKMLFWRLIESRVLRDASLTLFTSEEERILARKSFQPYSCVEAVANLGTAVPKGNPADQRKAFYAKFPNLIGKRIILFLGRLHEKKGCDLAISAFARLQDEIKVNDGTLHLVMAGPGGDSEYGEVLKRMEAQKFGSRRSDVTWAGMLAGEEKWGAYRAADAFILPSHQENFGLAVVEALACGLPVLISKRVNIWCEIARSRAGLVSNDDFEGTFDLLSRWEKMSEQARDEMRLAAHACYAANFEINKAASRLAELLQEIANDDGNNHHARLNIAETTSNNRSRCSKPTA